MRLVRYQTPEALTPEEFDILRRIVERFNAGRRLRGGAGVQSRISPGGWHLRRGCVPERV